MAAEHPYPQSEPGVVDLGTRHFVWHQSEGIWLWWHDCPAVAHVSWGWFGQSLDGGDHGYIENGAWRVA